MNLQPSTDIPKFLHRRDAVLCLRCLVEVDAAALSDPARCVDKNCPLKPKESAS